MMPVALFVMLLVASLASVAVVLATHNVDRSTRDRNSVRALEAADAGLDTAAYRMGKMVLASKTTGLLSPDTINALRAEVGCLQLSVLTVLQVQLQPTGCTSSAAETVDGSVGDDGLGGSATYRYWIKLGATIPANPNVLYRDIVSVGEANGVVRRVMGRYALDLSAPATALTKRVSYSECDAEVPAAGTDPTTGC